MKKFIHTLIIVAIVSTIFVSHGAALAQMETGRLNATSVPAFPGAEGFGANTLGGRGGKIFEVTNVNDSGSGSLRACVEASGARTCVFRVGGLIQLQSALVIQNPYITIAGQTAPGGGITLKKTNGGDALVIKTHDVILRYLASRPGPGGENHGAEIASNGDHLYNIIIDHCSFSWGTDEVLETWYKVTDTTIQWTIVSEGLDCSTHSKGCHSKGLMVGGYADSESKQGLGSENITVHHNLFAHNGERNPLVQTSGLVDVVNNIAYNPFGTFMYLYMKSNSIVPVNYVGNFYKYGPETDSGKYEIKTYDDGGLGADIYVAGNIGPHRKADNLAQDVVVETGSRGFLTSTRHPAPQVTTTSAFVAYDQVLAGAGNSAGVSCDGQWVNRRDSIDARVVNDVRNGTGHIIDDPSQVGGWVTPAAGAPCADSDHDGMPDAYEARYGLNPNSAADANADADADGYPNVEEAINGTIPSGGGGGPQEQVANGGFETYPVASNMPARWQGVRFTAGDGKDAAVKYEGAASVKIAGDPAVQKILTQTLLISGNTGETMNFSFWVRGVSIPAQGAVCEGLALLYKAGVIVERKNLKCPTGSFAFRKLSIAFPASASFDKVAIRIRFKSTGTIWFDKVSLVK
ncbi:MAG: hypothetical protein HY867_18490 [Chloroflexi bacterium]|nr:hypothetical protein [Chloroflexota bacterium]